MMDAKTLIKRLRERRELHAADLIEKQAAELAALRAEVARLKTVPMKYRRMEFNAQLQQENAELRAAIDAMRFSGSYHKEQQG